MRKHLMVFCASCAFLAGAALLPPPILAADETTVGAWTYEDKTLKEKVVIKKSGEEYFALVESGGGGARKVPLAGLMVAGCKRFLRKGGREYYQIETTGNLGSYGEKGLIRSALRTDKPKDYCYRAGRDYGRAAKILAIAGKDIKKNIKVAIPEECEGLPETRKGISEGAAAIQP